MPELTSEVETLDRGAVLRRLDAARFDPPTDQVSYAAALRRQVVASIIRAYGPAIIEAPCAGPDEAPAMWLRLANEILREAGAGYSLESDAGDPLCHLCILDAARDGRRTEYGTFLPTHIADGRPAHDVDWGRLIAALADLHFLESVHYKVSRLSVVSDPALYPFWIVGRRLLRRLRPVRPEVGIHYRFLQSLTLRREARLYRALTPRWEVRRDRVAGVRRWRGLRSAPAQL